MLYYPNRNKVAYTADVEKILKNSIEEISKKAIILPPFFDEILPRTDEADLDEKDKEILDYISKNSGIIQERLLSALENKTGYSRRAFYRIIKKLKQSHMVTVEPDKINKRIHHLYINNYNIIISLLDDLVAFNKAYFNLIDNLTRLEMSFSSATERLQMANAITMPFRFFIIGYGISSIILSWQQTSLDKQTLHRKFTLMYRHLQEVHSKLSDTMLDTGLIETADEILVEGIIEKNSGILNPKEIITVLNTFDKYGLRENIELVLDCLWRISHPIIRLSYPYYTLKNPAVQKDWRKLLEEYERLPMPVERTNYRISKTD